jgi:hypothetical protein
LGSLSEKETPKKRFAVPFSRPLVGVKEPLYDKKTYTLYDGLANCRHFFMGVFQ